MSPPRTSILVTNFRRISFLSHRLSSNEPDHCRPVITFTNHPIRSHPLGPRGPVNILEPTSNLPSKSWRSWNSCFDSNCVAKQHCVTRTRRDTPVYRATDTRLDIRVARVAGTAQHADTVVRTDDQLAINLTGRCHIEAGCSWNGLDPLRSELLISLPTDCDHV